MRIGCLLNSSGTHVSFVRLVNLRSPSHVGGGCLVIVDDDPGRFHSCHDLLTHAAGLGKVTNDSGPDCPGILRFRIGEHEIIAPNSAASIFRARNRPRHSPRAPRNNTDIDTYHVASDAPTVTATLTMFAPDDVALGRLLW